MWGLRNQGFKCKGEADTIRLGVFRSTVFNILMLPTLAATSNVCGLCVFDFLCIACHRNENILVLKFPGTVIFILSWPFDRLPQKHTAILAVGIVVSEARGLISAIVREAIKSIRYS